MMKKLILVALFVHIVVSIKAQTERKYFTLGAGIKYDHILSSQKSNSNPSNTLFGGNGHSIGLVLQFFTPKKEAPQTEVYTKKYDDINKISWQAQAKMQFGNTSHKDLEAFAKSLTKPLNYKIEQTNNSWQQFVIIAGPSLALYRKEGKRISGFFAPATTISIQAGIANQINSRTIIIDKYDGSNRIGNVYDQTDKKNVFAWEGNISVPIAKLGKRLNLCLEGGYGFNGGMFGVKLGYTNKAVVERIVKDK